MEKEKLLSLTIENPNKAIHRIVVWESDFLRKARQ
jgi:hypothetical protein